MQYELFLNIEAADSPEDRHRSEIKTQYLSPVQCTRRRAVKTCPEEDELAAMLTGMNRQEISDLDIPCSRLAPKTIR